MDEQQFKQSVRLFNFLGETKLISGKTLRTELFLEQDISLWDVVAPYMVLYRFPLLFSFDCNQSTLRNHIKYYLRPYRGQVARFRDSIISFLSRKNDACTKWPEGDTTMLFLGINQIFYRDVLSSVAESLVTKKNIQAVVISQEKYPFAETIANKKIRFQSFWEHWDKDTEKCSHVLLKHLRTLQKMVLNKNQLRTMIQNMADDFGRFAIQREFHWLFWREFKRLIPIVAAAKHILDRHKPKLIISADDADQRYRIYSLLAREMGIPCLLVQQGLTNKAHPEWLFFSKNIVAAMGQTSRADMIEQGVLPEQIIVTGNPGFDRLVLPEPDVCSRLRSTLGLLDGQKMILFASQPYYVSVFNTSHVRRKMINAIVQAACLLENVRLVIKPHPGDNIRELKRLIGKAPRVVIVDQAMDISPLIKTCDVLITFFSTVALQALYAGKPVINVDFPNSGGAGATIYAESGATWIARSTDEIATHIQNLTNETRNKEISSREAARQRFLYHMVYIPDGQATERVLKVVLNMLQL